MLLYIKVNGDKSALSRRKADKGLAHIYLYDGDTLVTGPDGKRSGLPERRPPSPHRWQLSSAGTSNVAKRLFHYMERNGAAAIRGGRHMYILLPVCRYAHAVLPDTPLYAGSIRCSACCRFRPAQAIGCASESLCMGLTSFFRLERSGAGSSPCEVFLCSLSLVVL